MKEARDAVLKIREEVQDQIDYKMGELLKQIPNKIEQVVEDSVCRYLGIERTDQKGRYRATRHTSFSGKSRLQEFIEQRCDVALQRHGQIIDDLIEDAFKKKSFIPSLVKLIDETATEYKVRQVVRDKVEARMERLGDEITEAFSNQLEGLGQLAFSAELEDPEAFQGVVGEAALESIADELSEQE